MFHSNFLQSRNFEMRTHDEAHTDRPTPATAFLFEKKYFVCQVQTYVFDVTGVSHSAAKSEQNASSLFFLFFSVFSH